MADLSCNKCPLRALPLFLPHSTEELKLVESLKRSELRLRAGRTLILGLSLVHTNKTLRKLERRGLHRIEDGRLHLVDVKKLARIADLYGDGRPPPRPLI